MRNTTSISFVNGLDIRKVSWKALFQNPSRFEWVMGTWIPTPIRKRCQSAFNSSSNESRKRRKSNGSLQSEQLLAPATHRTPQLLSDAIGEPTNEADSGKFKNSTVQLIGPPFLGHTEMTK
jgi:hypothetical protein